MKPEEINAKVCNCSILTFSNRFDRSYRHSITKHIICPECQKPFRSLAVFICILCGEPAINNYFYEYNALRDYDSNGNLITFNSCRDCNE